MSTTNQTNSYFGWAEGDFKSSYNNYTLSLRSKGQNHGIELSKNVWSLKDGTTEFNIKWRIKAKAMPYKCSSRKCDLFLDEKVAIAQFEGVFLLNKTN